MPHRGAPPRGRLARNGSRGRTLGRRVQHFGCHAVALPHRAPRTRADALRLLGHAGRLREGGTQRVCRPTPQPRGGRHQPRRQFFGQHALFRHNGRSDGGRAARHSVRGFLALRPQRKRRLRAAYALLGRHRAENAQCQTAAFYLSQRELPQSRLIQGYSPLPHGT